MCLVDWILTNNMINRCHPFETKNQLKHLKTPWCVGKHSHKCLFIVGVHTGMFLLVSKSS